MISIKTWSWRIQAALGREPQSVEEAIDGLRKVLRGDEVLKKEFFQLAESGDNRFERFSRDDKTAKVVWAALKTALEKTRKRLPTKPSTQVVRQDDKVREEAKVKGFPWTGPDGRTYMVYPWDLNPTVRKGAQIRHPQCGLGTIVRVEDQTVTVRFKGCEKKLDLKVAKSMLVNPYAHQPDRRVAAHKEALERFFLMGEEVYGLSRIERAEEFANNPHLFEGIISKELEDRLERLGLPVSDLEDMVSLVSALPAKEKKFRESVEGIVVLKARSGATAVRRGEDWQVSGQNPAILEGITAYQALMNAFRQSKNESWTIDEMKPLKKLAGLVPANVYKGWIHLLHEIAAIRRLKVELERASIAPVRAVAYRDSSGEVVYMAPVIGD